MTQKRKGLRSMLLALVGCTCSGTAAADSHPSSQTLYPLGTQGSFAGPDNLFTGDVKVDILFPENEKAHFSGAYVHFAPGARTAWHTHPAGQHMIVTDGIALTGTRAGDVFAFSAGETVWCPPDIDHWHGATPHASMTHLVITGSKDGENVIWKEKVTDAQYAQALDRKAAPDVAMLTAQQQAMVPIAAWATQGNLASLEQAIVKGLDAGLSVNEIKELQVHLYAYTGFPRALNAIATLMRIVDERKANGIEDRIGEQPSAIPVGNPASRSASRYKPSWSVRR